ncbi:SIR2 family protein [Notoacmeibacter marinus]|uniref:SIR2 family protein n=1 Tax=Notoacmeibacter marinus TaxID=1876515 RepID=UPI000DF3A475|nr:SIR2 family protein [Notoacmeibacter marinus]
MEIKLSALANRLTPYRTSLFLGAGASKSSGAPLGSELQNDMLTQFKIEHTEYLEFSSACTLVEKRFSRHDLVSFIESKLSDLKPSGGILDLPRYNWSTIYSTNFDTLVEQVYKSRGVGLTVINNDHEYHKSARSANLTLLKLHGSVGVDSTHGNGQPMVLTRADFRSANEYRQTLFNNLENSLSDQDLIIVGYSLGDPHLQKQLQEIAEHKSEKLLKRRPVVCVMEANELRIMLLEEDGFDVCKCSFDELIAALLKERQADNQLELLANDSLDVAPELRSSVRTVKEDAVSQTPSVSRMYNGRPSTYADIRAGLTFRRDCTTHLKELLSKGEQRAVVLVGVSGVGKTTLARQVCSDVFNEFESIWERIDYSPLDADRWSKVHEDLLKRSQRALLFIDDFDNCFESFNRIVDNLANCDSSNGLYIIGTVHMGSWKSRQKAYSFFRKSVGVTKHLSKLSSSEIQRLIELYRGNPEIRQLSSEQFSGFSQGQIQERLKIKAKADMFVCLKNIFGSEELDDIILNEFGNLSPGAQEVYRLTAALQSSGANAHRLMILRLGNLGISSTAALLEELTDIIEEVEVRRQPGIFSWEVRHEVIAKIVRKYKFGNEQEIISLFDSLIDSAVPFNPIERETLIGICGSNGIQGLSKSTERLRLFRRIVSVAPDIKVPRHFLIKELIARERFDDATTEIASFKQNFQYYDTTISRLRADILFKRSTEKDAKSVSDRVYILSQARAIIEDALGKSKANIPLLDLLFKVGVQIYKFNKDLDTFNQAENYSRRAFEETENSEFIKISTRYDRLMSGQIG